MKSPVFVVPVCSVYIQEKYRICIHVNYRSVAIILYIYIYIYMHMYTYAYAYGYVQEKYRTSGIFFEKYRTVCPVFVRGKVPYVRYFL